MATVTTMSRATREVAEVEPVEVVHRRWQELVAPVDPASRPTSPGRRPSMAPEAEVLRTRPDKVDPAVRHVVATAPQTM